MSDGVNISGTNKGARSYARLNAIRVRIPQIARFIYEKYKKEITDVSEDEIVKLFRDMERGIIKKIDGTQYKSTADYIKDFKAFWHWYMRYSRKYENKIIPDITTDMSGVSRRKSNFVYFTIEDLKKLCDFATYEYRVLMWFLYDSGVRAPSELVNIRVKDITQIKNSDKLLLTVRDEVSKTFVRKIKLMLCHNLIEKYIENKNLKLDDFIFKFNPVVANRYIKKLGYTVLKKGTPVKDINDDLSTVKNGLTLYDFRHVSACYWVTKYKNETALRYRFGWKNPRMVEYYSQFIGMKDSIQDEDLEDSETRTQMQKEIDGMKKDRLIMEEELKAVTEQMNKINTFMNKLTDKNSSVLDNLALKAKKEKLIISED